MCRNRKFISLEIEPNYVRFAPESGPSGNIGLNYRFVLRFQRVDATHSLNFSAGVLKPNVFRGRSLS